MKIVYTTTVYLPHIGGIELCIHELAQYMIRMGHSVTIIVGDNTCSDVKIEKNEGERIVRIPTSEVANFSFLRKRKYKKVIENEIADADVVHVNVCKFLFGYFAKKKKKYGYKLIASSHGWIFHTQKYLLLKKIYFKLVVMRYSALYDHVINVSNQDKDIADRYGVKNSCVILNGVDLNKFSNIKSKDRFTHRFVYLGRISENKGIYECLCKLRTYKEQFVFSLVGRCEDKPYMDRLNSLISESGLNNSVFFYGGLSDEEAGKIIEEADIILMPSLHEGFGMTLVECLVANRPIIANTIESYISILKSVDKAEYLFDYCSETSDFNDMVSKVRNADVRVNNLRQYSIEDMASKTLNYYL